ncbi:MAG: J domain-containing protein [Parachlamydiaceae bacterium]|nr:J domain-containing protein [Parachlamydiaceae bacterium]
MSIPSFNIDHEMLQNFSVNAINDKSDQLGFYKTNDHTYVITTKNSTTNPNFTAQMGQIVALFADAQFTIDASLEGPDSIKFAQYLECVHRIVDRHNSNVNKNRENAVVQFLLQLPIISSVVEWIFDQLLFSFPDSACVVFENRQRDIIANYLQSAEDWDTLDLYRQNLLNDLTNAQNPDNPLRGEGFPEDFWLVERRMVQQEFEKQVFDRSEVLQLAQNIVDNIEPALNFDLKIDHFEGPARCAARLKSLTLSPDLDRLVSETQKNLIKTAQDQTMQAFGQWHIQRIKMLCKNASKKATEPLLTDLLLSNNPDDFTKKFFSLASRISPLSAKHQIATLQTHFCTYRKGLIEKRLGESENLQMLQTCKVAMLKELEELKVQQNPLHGKEYQTEFWKNEQLTIQNVFEEELTKRSPILQKIQGIMAANDEDFEIILGFGLNVDPFSAAGLCNTQTKSLDLPEELMKLDAIRLTNIVTSAKQKIVMAYGNWHGCRINSLCKNAMKEGKKPLIEDLLITREKSQFKVKYDSLIKRLSSVKQTRAKTDLETFYEDYLGEIFGSLHESLASPKTMFAGLSLEELNVNMKEKSDILDEWFLFKKKGYLNLSRDSLEHYKMKLREAYDFNLLQTVPVFGIALDILGERKGPILSLTGGSSSAATNQTEKWYRHNLDVIRFELSQPYTEHISPQALAKMKEAEKCLLIELSKLKEKQVQELLTIQEKSDSMFELASSILPSFISNWFVDQSELPLKPYRELLLKVLEITKVSHIEGKYEVKIKELSELPNSDVAKNQIMNVYESYHRAQKIQPLIRMINPGSMFSGKISLEKLVKKMNLFTFNEKENYVNELCDLLDQEIAIQSLNPKSLITSTLKSAKYQLENQLETMLIEANPLLGEMKKICKNFEISCLGMYKHIIDVPFQDRLGNSLYTQAVEKYEKMLKKFEIDEDSDQPMCIKKITLRTKEIILYAYKEWEAEHILFANETFQSENEFSYFINDDMKEKKRSAKVIGLSYNSPRTERIKRYRNLCTFLHPDKNYGIPEELLEKYVEASKVLGNPPSWL